MRLIFICALVPFLGACASFGSGLDYATEKAAVTYTTTRCSLPSVAKLWARYRIMQHSSQELVMVSKCKGDPGYAEFRRTHVELPIEAMDSIEDRGFALEFARQIYEKKTSDIEASIESSRNADGTTGP